MIGYADIAELVDAGKTDAEIASILEPLGVTVRKVPLKELKWYLRDQGLIYRGVDVPYIGPFAELVRSEQTPEELRGGLIDFITHVFGTDEYLDTTDYVIAARGVAMLAGLIQAGVMTPEQRDGFYQLGGGLKFAGVTEADVARTRRRHLLDTAILAAQSAFSRDESAGDIEAAFAAGLGGW